MNKEQKYPDTNIRLQHMRIWFATRKNRAQNKNAKIKQQMAK